MPVIAFCGIDGSGKTTLISRLRQQVASACPDVSVITCRNRVSTCREFVAGHLNFDRPATFLVGTTATWYALASALDFARHIDQFGKSAFADASNKLTFMDRYVDCYIAFAGTVRPSCQLLVERLLLDVPRADLTFHVWVPPEVAWKRVVERLDGPAPDESLMLMHRFDIAYRRLFDGRPDAIQVQNTGTLAALTANVMRELEKRELIPSTSQIELEGVGL
jgi:thymidylate kinase